MDLIKLAKQVKAMRDAQKKYFSHKRNGNINTLEILEHSKKLEKDLDKTIDEVLKVEENKNQKSLF